jgi:hypothetical protein
MREMQWYGAKKAHFYPQKDLVWALGVLVVLFCGRRSGPKPRSMEFEVMWIDGWEDYEMKRIGGA